MFGIACESQLCFNTLLRVMSFQKEWNVQLFNCLWSDTSFQVMLQLTSIVVKWLVLLWLVPGYRTVRIIWHLRVDGHLVKSFEHALDLGQRCLVWNMRVKVVEWEGFSVTKLSLGNVATVEKWIIWKNCEKKRKKSLTNKDITYND